MLSIEQCRVKDVSRFACLLKNVVLVVIDYTGMLIFYKAVSYIYFWM